MANQFNSWEPAGSKLGSTTKLDEIGCFDILLLEAPMLNTADAGSGVSPTVYAEAPLMKNHLSIELSIFSAGRFSLGGIGGSWSGLMRLGDWATARLVLLKRKEKKIQC